jgi:RpiR family transcriptional regulator, carbohydrate utilization regulator
VAEKTGTKGSGRSHLRRIPRASPRAVPAGTESPPLLLLIRGQLSFFKRAQRRIAEALLNDPETFISHSVSELAELSGVSTGSVVLFCKSLGLPGLPALKISLARELAEAVLPSAERPGPRGAGSILQRVSSEHIRSLRETLRLNAAQTLTEAATTLAHGRRIVLFSIGLSYPVAYSLYARLRFIGLPAFVEFDSHLQLAAAAEMKPGEVGVGISVAGTTMETVECLRLAKARGAKTVCITNSIGSPLAQAADVRLYAAPSEVKYFQAPLASRVTQLALADALLVMLGLRRKRRALAHLEQAEEHLLKRRLGGGRVIRTASSTRETGASKVARGHRTASYRLRPRLQ